MDVVQLVRMLDCDSGGRGFEPRHSPFNKPRETRGFFIQMEFYVYIVQTEKDGSFYFGQTNNLENRLTRHNAGSEKYTSKKTPWKLFWHTKVSSRAEAMKLEKKLKNLKSTKRMVEFSDNYRENPLS